MRKRLLAVTLGLLLAIGAVPALAEDAGVDTSTRISVTLNGTPLSFDVQPARDRASGSVLVPMRRIFEALGATLTWNAELQQVTATGGGANVVLTIGHTQATVNNQSVTLVAAPVIVDGRTLVPLRFVAESLGALVGWYPGSENTATVTIDVLPGDPMAPMTVLFRAAKQYKGDLQGNYTTSGQIAVGPNDPNPIKISLSGKARGSESMFTYGYQLAGFDLTYNLRVTGSHMWVKSASDPSYTDAGYNPSLLPDFSKGGAPQGLNLVDPLSGGLLPAITGLRQGQGATLEKTSYTELVASLDPGRTATAIVGWAGYLGSNLTGLTVDSAEAHTWVHPSTYRTRRTTVTVTGKAPAKNQGEQPQPFSLTITSDAVPDTSPVSFPAVQ